MATITILSRALIPATQLQPERIKIGISSSDASLIQSSPNDLNLYISNWFGSPYTFVINDLYNYLPLPPYNNYWFIIQEGFDWFIYFNVNPYTYTTFISYMGWDNFTFPYDIPPADPNFINIIQQSEKALPVYNPIVYRFSSPKYNEVGYRYLVDIKDNSNNLINRLKVVPLPDGTGYVDIQKILSNYITYDFIQGQNYLQDCPNSYFRYKLEIGEEYLSSWEYTNFVEQIGGNFDGYVVLNNTNTAILHTYQPGDQITIDTDISGLAQNVGGLHTVLLVPNGYQVVIDVIYPNNDPSIVIPGSTRYSDSRKTGYSNLVSITNKMVWNGVFSWNDWKFFNFSTYSISYLNTYNLLTNLKPYQSTDKIHERYMLVDGQSFYINYMVDVRLSSTQYSLIITDPINSISDSILLPGIAPLGIIRQFKIDHSVLSSIGITDWEYVDFYLALGISQRTKTYRLYNDKRCKINDTVIYFMDKLGSILSIPFQLKQNESLSINKEIFKKPRLYNRQSLDLTTGGDTINHISSKKSYQLNTNWMNDRQMELFEIMMESPNTWIELDGILYTCIIEDSSLEIDKYKNKSIFKKSVKVYLGNQNPLNI